MRTEYIQLGLTAALAVILGFALWAPSRGLPAGEETPPGRLLFIGTGCGGCHSAAGYTSKTNIGPPLVNLGTVGGTRVPGLDARGYIEQSIRQPQAFTVPGYESSAAVMPTFELTDDEVKRLVDFLVGS